MKTVCLHERLFGLYFYTLTFSPIPKTNLIMKLKIVTLAIAGAMLQTAGWSQAKLLEKVVAKGNELVIPYEKYVLPNGLTVIVHEDHSDPIVHTDVTYHVGSAREEIGKSGFAHFFEHMMFQGSDNVADEQHFKIVTEAGGTLNGSTNRDRTNYFETAPSNQLEKMLWLEADRMGFLLDAVTQKKFEVQRATVKNERGQNYDNQPYGLLGEVASKNLYPYGHPYSWLTIGYVEELNVVNVNDLKNFFLRWYGPNNATLTVGGDVKAADVVKLAEKYFGTIPRGPEVKPAVFAPVVLEKDRYVSYTDNYARAPQLRIVYPTVADYHPDMAALACLAQVLGQGGGGGGRGGRGGGGGGNRSSILYQTIIKEQKALQASASSSLSELAGEFALSITPFPGKSLTEMEQLLNDALVAFEKRGVTDEDIVKFKNGNESRTINGLASVSGKVSQLAAFQTFTGNANMTSKLLQMYQGLTKEDVMRVYEKYIKGKHKLVVSVVTKGQENLKAAADNYVVETGNYKAPNYGYAGLKYVKGKDNFNRHQIPGNGPNPVVKVPPFWTASMSNGVRFTGTQNAEIPTVTINISLPGGHLAQANDTAKIGLSGMLAAMLNEDTQNFTAEQMTVELQKLGSSISVSSDLNSLSFNVQCLKKNLAPTLKLLEERFSKPNFTEDAFKRLQRQAMERFKQSRSLPAAIATAVFDKINYGPGNILGMSENGTEYSISKLTLSDIQNCYNDHFTSPGAKVVVVGDISQNEIMPGLQFLDKLLNKKMVAPVIGAAPAIGKTKIFLVDVPKAAQTEFRVGFITGLKYDATGEFYKAGLMNYVLGGAFNSRININLREDKGWTYGARSSFSGNEYTGAFAFSSGIKAEATDSALSEVIKEINGYASGGITAEELQFTKNAIGQRDALQYETGQQKAGFIGRIMDYNLPANFVDQQNKILATISKSDISSLAAKWLNTAKMNILLVGDKAKIVPGLKRLGYEITELDADGKMIGNL